jgi:Helix-turn-helix domain
MSPLQYQKKIRLHEARARLMTKAEDVANVGFSVGYESPSQFSREYAVRSGRPRVVVQSNCAVLSTRVRAGFDRPPELLDSLELRIHIVITAMLAAFVAPRLGFALICAALILHLRPDVTSR